MKNTLLEVIKQIPAKQFTELGSVISFADICDLIRNTTGRVDPVFIELKIAELEKAGQLKVIKKDDLIIGVSV